MSQKVYFGGLKNGAEGPKKMAVDPVRAVQECSKMTQMKAKTKIQIYKLVLVAKIYVLSLQKKLNNREDKSAAPRYK